MDTVEVTEKQRLQLETSIVKLRKALKHWQIHSAEYEGLKEELLSLPKTAGRDTILTIADDFGGDVVTREEITTFLGDKEGVKRGPVQVAEAVRHRIDYIQGNINNIEKQLELGEATLENVRVIKNSGQLTNEEGLPVMDIREDLDEKGVVIKSDVNPAAGGSAKPFNVTAAIESFQPLVDTLSKKQKEKEKKADAAKPQEKPKVIDSAPSEPSTSKATTSNKKPPSKDQIQQKPKSKAQPKTPKRIESTEKEYSTQTGMILTEKRVKAKLVPDVKEEAPQPVPKEEVSIKEIVSVAPSPVDLTTPEQTKPGAPQKEGIARIRVLDDSDDDEDLDEDSEDPFNNLPNVEESEEDAQMREEMIKYNMREMNNIVAEIELDEDEDDYDDEEDEDEDEDEEEEENEDQWGRSKGRLVSNKVRREMMLLQKKIEAREKAAQVAAEVEAESKALAANTEQNKAIPVEEQPKKEKEKKKASEKKGVRFAEELDIAPAPEGPIPLSKPPSNASQLVGNEFDDEDIDPSILDMIFGPGTADQEARYFQNTTEQPKKKLPSLFKAARQVQKAKEQSAIEKAPPAISGVVERATPTPGSYEIIERTPSTNAPTAPTPSGKMPTRKTPPSKSTTKPKAKEPAPAPALDPLGAELSDEDRPIMASSVIERAPTWEAKSPSSIERAPTAPDELNPEIHQREVSAAYYNMRNKLIQRQGGFVETEEEKMEVPIDENLEKKKVSRFKAGRVKSQMP
ncbi:hypothetical protein TWF730_009996 [Orbilia blumenaviensis]|uniref:DUF3835 domain-containing protein n=1 Tax=Orbilia blumenaviensis TaxID=1796055 RepID=A0AAV9UTE4_9PEZI